VPAADIKCHSQLFSSCTPNSEERFGGDSADRDAGNPNGTTRDSERAELRDYFLLCQGQLLAGRAEFNGHASASAATPEPGTIALMVTGLGAIDLAPQDVEEPLELLVVLFRELVHQL
jgi:hypothetical protein